MVLTWLPAHDSDVHVIYAIDESLRIVRCNSAWDKFALDNNGSAAKASNVVGVCLYEVIPGELWEFYDKGFQSAKQAGQWQHLFDCSSARVMRRLRMTVSFAGAGFLIRNVLVKDALAPASEAGGNFADYGQAITMCCHCRRVENKRTSAWQWVPEFIEELPRDFRTRLCPECRVYHYGEPSRSGDEANSAA